MGMGGQHHTPTALPPGKTRYPSYRRLGGPQGRSGRVRKISPPLGFDPRTVQSVASRYTDPQVQEFFTESRPASGSFVVIGLVLVTCYLTVAPNIYL